MYAALFLRVELLLLSLGLQAQARHAMAQFSVLENSPSEPNFYLERFSNFIFGAFKLK